MRASHPREPREDRDMEHGLPSAPHGALEQKQQTKRGLDYDEASTILTAAAATLTMAIQTLGGGRRMGARMI